MANVPLSPHAGATRGTLARYAHGNELLRRSAYADARSALNRYGFRVVLRTLIEKKGGIGSRLFRFFRLSRSPGLFCFVGFRLSRSDLLFRGTLVYVRFRLVSLLPFLYFNFKTCILRNVMCLPFRRFLFAFFRLSATPSTFVALYAASIYSRNIENLPFSCLRTLRASNAPRSCSL